MLDSYGSGMGWGGWFVMSAMMTVLIGVLIFGAILIWRTSHRDMPKDQSSNSARQLLDERLARGDINADEYNERTELLRSGR